MTRSDCNGNFATSPHCDAVAAVAVAPDDRIEERAIRWFAAFLAYAFIIALATTASAQVAKFEVLPVDPNIDSRVETYKKGILTFATAQDLSSFPKAQQDAIGRYFTQYLPAKITQPKDLSEINELMDHASGMVERSAKMNAPASRNLMTWMFSGMKRVATGNYQPTARVIAINYIANMSKPSPNRGGLPRPFPIVLAEMKSIYMDSNNPDSVRAAALHGLDHYVRFTPASAIKDEDKTVLTTAMTELLAADPPAGRDPMVHAYLQRYAVNILTNLSTDATLGKQLVSVSVDEKQPNLLALHSAAAIADLPGKMGEGDVETEKVLQQWAKRLLLAFEAEVDRLESWEKKTSLRSQPAPPESFANIKKDESGSNSRTSGLGGGYMDDMEGMMGGEMDDMEGMMGEGMEGMMGGSMEDMMEGMGGMGGMMGAVEKPQPPELTATRQKLNYALQQVLLGVIGDTKLPEEVETVQPRAGLMVATAADSREVAIQWLTNLDTIIDGLNDKSISTRPNFIKELEVQIETLQSLADGKAVKKKDLIEVNPFGEFGNPMAPPPSGDAAAPGEDDLNAGIDDIIN